MTARKFFDLGQTGGGVGHNYFSKSSKSGASPKTYQSDAAGVEVAAGGTISLGLLIIGGVLYRGSIGRSIVVKGRAATAPVGSMKARN
jgi:hypothetical protein